jgi:hypothetical protein
MNYTKLSKEFGITLYSNEKESQVAALRLSVCSDCESNVKDTAGTKLCLECGCYLGAKALQLFAKCPLNKWIL